MLALRPSCEHCDKSLPPQSTEAMICSFECTFCQDCVDTVLKNVCPNCGGGFTPRPVRPTQNWRNNNCLSQYPASTEPVVKPVDANQQADLIKRVGRIPADKR